MFRPRYSNRIIDFISLFVRRRFSLQEFLSRAAPRTAFMDSDEYKKEDRTMANRDFGGQECQEQAHEQEQNQRDVGRYLGRYVRKSLDRGEHLEEVEQSTEKGRADNGGTTIPDLGSGRHG